MPVFKVQLTFADALVVLFLSKKAALCRVLCCGLELLPNKGASSYQSSREPPLWTGSPVTTATAPSLGGKTPLVQTVVAAVARVQGAIVNVGGGIKTIQIVLGNIHEPPLIRPKAQTSARRPRSHVHQLAEGSQFTRVRGRSSTKSVFGFVVSRVCNMSARL
ncbi:hypothetical protein F2P81_023096 [Scophthalmus maximus]|uniref:Secreted protein n=1 Tax=Scophthalmus maximus TaxID=52904 RepID=A0A6A4S1B5_SCOMX|nr:hypothetical protein F2P81_023096 [Scophthalmus maximus]